MRLRPLRRSLPILLTLLALLAGCGVQVDSEPQALPRAELPDDLLDTDPGPLPRTASVYMIGPDDRLIPVGRFVEFRPDVSTQALLLIETLIAGTFPAEVREGITTAINRATEVTSVLDAGDGLAFVDLSDDSLLSLSFDEQENAYAQIVYTLTDLPEFDRVIFSIGDRFNGVPTDNGLSPPGDSVGREDFASLDPFRPAPAFPTGADSDPVAPTPVPQLPDEVPTVVLPTPDPSVDLIVWMLDAEDRLVPRPRQAERSPLALVQTLLLGPSQGEPEAGIRSAIPTTATLVGVDDDDANTAFVILGPGSLPPVTGDDERKRAVAQIVFTVTELSEFEAVTIVIGGERLPMPTDSGFTAEGARLLRSDFASLAPFPVGVPPVPVPTPTSNGAESDDEPDVTPSPEPTPTPEA